MGNVVPVGWGEVLLVQEALLQLVDLLVGEGRPRLAPLLGRGVLAEHGRLVPPSGVCHTHNNSHVMAVLNDGYDYLGWRLDINV